MKGNAAEDRTWGSDHKLPLEQISIGMLASHSQHRPFCLRSFE